MVVLLLGLLSQEAQSNITSKRKVRIIAKDSSGAAASNPRSILLPVSTGNGIRTFKIISGGASNRKIFKAVSSGNQVVMKSLRQAKMPLVRKPLACLGILL